MEKVKKKTEEVMVFFHCTLATRDSKNMNHRWTNQKTVTVESIIKNKSRRVKVGFERDY